MASGRSVTGSRKFFVLGLVAFVIVTWAAIAVFRSDFALEEDEALAEFGASALQFGFDSHHSGAQRAPLSVERYSKKMAFYPSKSIQAERTMPLFVNGDELSIPALDGLQVLIFGSGRDLLAWDLLANRIIWRVSKLPGELFSTPMLDQQFGRIYFLTSNWTRHENPNPKQAVFTIEHWIHSIGVDGKDLHSIKVPTREFLDHGYSEFTHDPSAFSMCKSAIGLNRVVSPNFIFFGCSMLTAPEFELFYGHMKGSRGLLFAVRLDDEHHVMKHGIAAFSPSTPTANPHTGFDTGIYNIGAGPVVLDDGSLILATGNGPFFPSEQNYGCSVVRINGTTLKAEAKQEGGYEYYSLEDGEFDECHGANLDMSSSSVVLLRTSGRYYAAVTGKDGTAKSFDPFNMPGQDRSLKHEYNLGGEMHGQPAIWQSGNGEIRINVIGRKEFPARLERESLVATKAVQRKLRNEYESLTCVGLVATAPGPGRVPLNLFYSGPYRNDYVSFIGNNGEVTDRYVERDPLPYRYQSSMGWIGNDANVRGPAGYRIEALNLYGDVLPHYHRKVGYFNATSDIAGKNFPDGIRAVETTGYIFTDEKAGGCGSYQGDDFKRIYFLSRKVTYEERALFAAFTINADYTLSKRWIRYADEGFEPHNMSPLVVLPRNNDETPLMIFAVAEISGKRLKSRLIVADAETGDIVDEIPFEGRPNSTMPLVIGNDIILSTFDHGIVFFADGRSTFDRINATIFPHLFARVRHRISR